MAPTFRYRYVDVGTVFTGNSRPRAAQNSTDSPSTLFRNELACDVGGTCWGPNEPLAILDDHLSAEPVFPSACAAVLHKAALIRERFSVIEDVVWLVAHREPDFDAFCSMYLARWIIEGGASDIDWQICGLHPEGWHDPPGDREIDWLNPDLSGFPVQHCWAVLLASYASKLEMRRRIHCPRQRELRSILYAAQKRGRDYLNETSGATEFFDQVKTVLQEKRLNPAFDSVLEGSAEFACELAMLDREVESYARDLRRARKALVYLPEAEAPSTDFFEQPKKVTSPQEASAENLLLAESFRIATDGIYLRDPECALFKEWAQVDLDHSTLGAGFEFTAMAHSRSRPNADVNSTQYVFAIDPERANGRHLYTVWSRLQTEEMTALRNRQPQPVMESVSRHTAATGARALDALLSDPWSGGLSRSSALVGTPRGGTLIGPPGARSDLRDDPVVEAVRTELESPIYAAASLVTGPQVAVYDLAASRDRRDARPRWFDLNAPLGMPPPGQDQFRFAAVRLRPDVAIAEGGAAGRRITEQIAETLWQILYPERPGEIPEDFEGHLVVNADSVGIWSERGIAIAQKHKLASDAGPDGEDHELRDFSALMSLAADINGLTATWMPSRAQTETRSGADGRASTFGSVRAAVAEGEELARLALALQSTLALPGRDLLRQFCSVINFEQLVARLREFNQSVGEHLRLEVAAEEGRRQEKKGEEIARVRRKTRWLELLVIGFVALEITGLALRNLDLSRGGREALTIFGSPLVLACAALLLQPWARKRSAGTEQPGWFKWIMIAALLVWLAAWLLQVSQAW